jgi:Helicase conserved C-terminal domain
MPLQNATECRDELLAYFRKHLVGPAEGETESIPLTRRFKPSNEYLTGTLYPQMPEDLPPDPSEARETGHSEKYDGPDEGSGEGAAREASNRIRKQSSCGITFTVPDHIIAFRLNGGFGRYLQGELSADGRDCAWTRVPSVFGFDVPCEVAGNKPYAQLEGMPADSVLRVLVRESVDNAKTITVTLVNGIICDSSNHVNVTKASFFQVGMEVSLADGAFIERPSRGITGMDADRKEALLLHLHSKEYAIGHGCAAAWQAGEAAPSKIRAEFLPYADVLPLVAPTDRTANLNMGLLAVDDTVAALALLSEIPAKYAAWIEQTRIAYAGSVPGEFRDVADAQYARCTSSVGRISAGIEALRGDADALLAFTLANKVMLEVMRRSEWERDKTAGTPYDPAQAKPVAECNWRPFQLAFVLQCITSITDRQSNDRKICDLLWFPTGGGKTEAYLLLTAFTLFYRRLKPQGGVASSGGVAVMMRYTLRLLTVDQFVRASRMICAAEHIRTLHPPLKSTPRISIGMYVGGGSTPNNFDEARRALNNVQKGMPMDGKGSPCKLVSCPWCNTSIAPTNYRVDMKNRRIALPCPNLACDFKTDIPVHVADDEVFAARPSLVIGTLDKFAQLAFRQDAGNLFATDGANMKPDLVIQDELHLVSGPLGTISGLYEAAIDKLCESTDGVRPKVIASTATIRNAGRQVTNLFDREVVQFPPPYIDSRDSFFARELTGAAGVAKSRRYVGMFGANKTTQGVMIKSAGVMLQGAKELDAAPAVKDPYWTTVGYFCSLRDLGGAIVRVQDDVRSLIQTLGSLPSSNGARNPASPLELTSRVDEQGLVSTRAQLGNSLDAGSVVDSVLCSNMISVGLDIPRLSLMFMLGQPKTTAEYIQASSRVGRKYPGLVFMLYSPTRSRDRSFYEHFQRYHGSFYAEVEATSVTPFASRARERALHAAFVIIARHTVLALAGPQGAAAFDPNMPKVQAIRGYLLDRFSRQDPSEAVDIERHLDSIISRWAAKVSEYTAGLCYSGNADPNGNLLVSFEAQTALLTEPSNEFPTMNQMRNVDAMCGISVLSK